MCVCAGEATKLSMASATRKKKPQGSVLCTGSTFIAFEPVFEKKPCRQCI